MKKLLITAIIAITAFTAQAQVAQHRRTLDFSKIYVRDGIEVVLTQGENESVRVVSDTKEDFAHVVTVSDGNTLKIHLDPKENDEKQPQNIKVLITQKELSGLKAGSGAAIVIMGEFKTSGFALDMAAGASFRGKINAKGAVRLSARSGSSFDGVVTADLVNGQFISGSAVKLAGFSNNASIYATSGATCLAPNFVCQNAVVNATQYGTVVINVKESIQASADETASVTYYGNPPTSTLGPDSYAIAKK